MDSGYWVGSCWVEGTEGGCAEKVGWSLWVWVVGRGVDGIGGGGGASRANGEGVGEEGGEGTGRAGVEEEDVRGGDG